MKLTNRAVSELLVALKAMSATAPSLPWKTKYTVARWLVVLTPAGRAIDIARQAIVSECVARGPVMGGDDPDGEHRVRFSSSGQPLIALPDRYRAATLDLDARESNVDDSELPRLVPADFQKAAAEINAADLAVLITHHLVAMPDADAA